MAAVAATLGALAIAASCSNFDDDFDFCRREGRCRAADAGAPDSGAPSDSGTGADAGDSGAPGDAGTGDAGADGGPGDAGFPDAGTDAGDSGAPDAGGADAGTWTKVLQVLDGGVALYGVWVAPSGDVFACGSKGTLLRLDAGVDVPSITTSGTTTFSAVCGTTGSEVFAVGSLGQVRTWQDGGWKSDNIATSADLYGVTCLSNGRVFAAGNDSQVFQRASFGNWSGESTVGGNLYNAIWGLSPNDIWVVGQSGVIVHRNATPAWVADTSSVGGMDLFGVSGTSASDVWVVGHDMAVGHWDGGSWTGQFQSATSRLWAVWAHTPTDAWAVGVNGLILHWDGTSWMQVASSTNEELRAISGRNAVDIWAVGAAGGIYHPQ